MYISSLRFKGEFLFPKQYQPVADELNNPIQFVTPEIDYTPNVREWPKDKNFFYFFQRNFDDSQFTSVNGTHFDIRTALYLKDKNVPFAYQSSFEGGMDTPETFEKNAGTPISNNADTDDLIAGKIALRKSFVWVPATMSGNPFAALSTPVKTTTAAMTAVNTVVPVQVVTLQERIKGAILALASGDALGCNVEFNSPDLIKQKFGVHKDITGGSTGPKHPYEYPRGAVTDDTQMTEMMAESLIAHPEGDMWDLRDRFVAWIKPNPPGTGKGTREVLARAEHLNPAKDQPDDAAKALWEADHKNGGGNGSIMRCSPIALMYASNPDKLKELSLKTCSITHYSPAAKASTLAYNRILAAIVNGTAKDKESFLSVYEEAAKEAETLSPETAQAIRNVPLITDKSQLKTSGYTLDTMQVALWALLNCDTLEDAIVTMVNLGGDTDSNAAVTGALFGALQGEKAVPKRWSEALLNGPQLSSLADRLYQKTQSLNSPA